LSSGEHSGPLAGEPLLEAVTDAMVALHLRYHGRIPATAETQLLGGELLACTLGGIYTDVEKTMIELQRTPAVHETRREFQAATRQKFIEVVERLSGRTVAAFISNYHVGPDLAVELFLLEPEGRDLTAGLGSTVA
jgi:uncharacterized protein YbcI